LANIFGGIIMEKDEVLSRSRGEKNNEYESKILKDSQIVGIFVIVAICIFFLITNAIISDMRGLENGIISFDYAAIIFAYLTGIYIYGFVKTKLKYNIIAGITFALGFICMLILYFINI
jgi:hypothetical protein